MQRIIGTEVEYGISSPSDPTANPILTSTQAVLAYAAAAGIQRAKRTRWDYEVESPLRDARGFDLSRASGPPPIVDADEVGAANMILTNGARLYVDHAHPEYSAPECTDPMDVVIWGKAGENVARYAGTPFDAAFRRGVAMALDAGKAGLEPERVAATIATALAAARPKLRYNVSGSPLFSFAMRHAPARLVDRLTARALGFRRR